jgi:hypothetical protein
MLSSSPPCPDDPSTLPRAFLGRCTQRRWPWQTRKTILGWIVDSVQQTSSSSHRGICYALLAFFPVSFGARPGSLPSAGSKLMPEAWSVLRQVLAYLFSLLQEHETASQRIHLTHMHDLTVYGGLCKISQPSPPQRTGRHARGCRDYARTPQHPEAPRPVERALNHGQVVRLAPRKRAVKLKYGENK